MNSYRIGYYDRNNILGDRPVVNASGPIEAAKQFLKDQKDTRTPKRSGGNDVHLSVQRVVYEEKVYLTGPVVWYQLKTN